MESDLPEVVNQPTQRKLSAYEEACKKACEWCRTNVPFCCDQHPHGELRFHRDPSWEHSNVWRTHQMCTAPTLGQFAESEHARVTTLEQALEATQAALRDLLQCVDVRDVDEGSEIHDDWLAVKQARSILGLTEWVPRFPRYTEGLMQQLAEAQRDSRRLREALQTLAAVENEQKNAD
jgi:hypothetical protein